MLQIKNKAQLNQLLQGDTPVLLDFYADWCGPCQSLLPIVESLADKHKDDFVIAKINVDDSGDIAQQFNVRSIPALFFVEDQTIKESLVGLQTKDFLDNKIQSYIKKAA